MTTDMREQEASFKAINDPHGYVLKGASWGTGVRPFRALLDLGLQEDHDVLDFGCGALRVGRFLMMYLDPCRYAGIEPSKWAVDEGLREIGTLVRSKKPEFRYPEFETFDAGVFSDRLFDFILISGVLTHMDHQQLRDTLTTAAGALKPHGRIVGSYLPVGPDHTGEGWLYPFQAAHYESCIREALPKGLTFQTIDVPGDPATWFDAWFEAVAR